MNQSKPIKKILLVVLDNLGDAVMATAVLRPLRKMFPQAEIGLWVKEYAGGLFADQSLIDTVHASDPFWDTSPGRPRGKRGAFLKSLLGIRRQKYDVAVILNTEWRRAMSCWFAGIPERVGYARRESFPFLTKALHSPVGLHWVDWNRKLIEGWSGSHLPDAEWLPRLELTQDEQKCWDGWAAPLGYKEGGYLVLHPFSGRVDRNWPLSCWIEFMQIFQKRQPLLRFVMICGSHERPQLEKYKDFIPPDVYQVLAGAPLPQLKAVLAKSRMLIGGDSGPGHVAAALGVPVLSLFGPSDPARFRPLGRAHLRVVKKDPLRHLLVPDLVSEVLSFLNEIQESPTTLIP